MAILDEGKRPDGSGIPDSAEEQAFDILHKVALQTLGESPIVSEEAALVLEEKDRLLAPYIERIQELETALEQLKNLPAYVEELGKVLARVKSIWLQIVTKVLGLSQSEEAKLFEGGIVAAIEVLDNVKRALGMEEVGTADLLSSIETKKTEKKGANTIEL